MKNYVVEVREILSRVIEVEAESEEDAKEKVQFAYDSEEIVLDWNDCVSNEIEFVREVK